MFVLVMIACMTFDGRTSCQEFERPHAFQSEQSCVRAGVIEEGRYAARGARRPWVRYTWNCRTGQDDPVRHNRGRAAG